jgi:hypothetical protein
LAGKLADRPSERAAALVPELEERRTEGVSDDDGRDRRGGAAPFVATVETSPIEKQHASGNTSATASRRRPRPIKTRINASAALRQATRGPVQWTLVGPHRRPRPYDPAACAWLALSPLLG